MRLLSAISAWSICRWKTACHDEYAFELLHHIEPLTALERQKSLADEEKIGIAPDDQALEELLADKKRLSKLRALYLGGYILLTRRSSRSC